MKGVGNYRGMQERFCKFSGEGQWICVRVGAGGSMEGELPSMGNCQEAKIA